MKYRSKQDPARVVDAFQWTGDNAAEVVAWGKANKVELLFRPDGAVRTHGHVAEPGDWLVIQRDGVKCAHRGNWFACNYEPYAPSATELATRGEWHYDSEGYVRPAGDALFVALIASWCGTEQRDANGRLMAASKDLYDAAVAARKALNGLPGTFMCPRHGSHTELIADLTKAIAKADFGSQE